MATSFVNFFNFPVETTFSMLSLRTINRSYRLSRRSKVFMEIFFLRFGGQFPVRTRFLTEMDFQKAVRAYFTSVLQILHAAEANTYSSSPHKHFREDITQHPLLSGIYAGRGSNNTDSFYNDRVPPVLFKTDSRSRTYNSVPIASIIYIVCQCIASDSGIRDSINSYAAQGHPCPLILQELLLGNRDSRCGNFQVAPCSIGLDSKTISICGLKNTILDIDYIKTTSGLASLFSFFSYLHNASDNYVKCSTFKPVILVSGETTTLNSLSCEPITWSTSDTPVLTTIQRVSETVRGKPGLSSSVNVPIPANVPPYASDFEVKVLPGHSYGEHPHLVHVWDSFIVGRRLEEPDGSQQIIGVYSPSVQFDFDNINLAYYVCKRGAGDLPNSTTQKPSFQDVSDGSKTDFVPAPKSYNRKPRYDKKSGPALTPDTKAFMSVVYKLVQSKQLTLNGFNHLVPILSYA